MQTIINNILKDYRNPQNQPLFWVSNFHSTYNTGDDSTQQTAMITMVNYSEDDSYDLEHHANQLRGVIQELIIHIQDAWDITFIPGVELTHGVTIYLVAGSSTNLLICYSDLGVYITYTDTLT